MQVPSTATLVRSAFTCSAAAVLCCTAIAQAAQDLNPVAIAVLVHDAARAQQLDLKHEGWAVRYNLHRVDARENAVRALVETSDGNVARTLERDGHPLTAEEQAAEVQRIQTLATKGLHSHGTDTTEKYGMELIAAMPQAMEWTAVAGQPQLPDSTGQLVVLDFKPREGFQPASAVQSLLKGVGGRMWIDERTHHLVRIDLVVLQDLNVALGLLARVYKGGTLTYEQVALDNQHDVYCHLEINVRLREFMVKNASYHLTIDTFNQQLLSSVPSLQQGIAMLLEH